MSETASAAPPPDFPYYNVLDQIYHAEWAAPKLARLELLAESIAALWPQGHPTKLIHVAGTSGKGSTCRFLEMGLGVAGRAGAFFSPHLFDYRERFSIDGAFARREDVAAAWEERVRPHCVQLALRRPGLTHSFHEVSILIALALFEQHRVEWAAMETGVGGRYDQTRGLDVQATLLTNVGSDHAHLLGKEQWQRTLDKAGIARRGIPFFTSEVDPQSLEIITQVCEHEGAPLHTVGPADVAALEAALAQHNGGALPEGALISAEYQRWNAALAQAALRRLMPGLDERAVLDAFRRTELIGRFWKVTEGVYADIAHNAEKIGALSGEIEQRFASVGRIVVIGMSGKRLPREIFPPLARVAKMIIVTTASFKGQEPEDVRRQIDAIGLGVPTLVIADPRQALHVARSMREAQDVVILTGSTYMIEQVLNPDPHLRQLSATFGWRMETSTEAHGTVHFTLPHGPSPLR